MLRCVTHVALQRIPYVNPGAHRQPDAELKVYYIVRVRKPYELTINRSLSITVYQVSTKRLSFS
jgi:hypothetical protein